LKKTFIIIVIGRILQVIVSFLTLKVVTNYLSKENVAYYFLLLSIMNYFGLSLISPAGQYFNRKVHFWHSNKILFNRMFNHFIYVSIISLFSVFVIYLCMASFELLNGLDPLLISTLIGTTILFNTITTTIVPTFNMLEYRISYVFFNLSWVTLSLISSVILINIFDKNVYYWFCGQIVVQFSISVIAIIFLKKTLKEPFSMTESFSAITIDNIKNVLSFSAPLLVSTMLMWITIDSFRFILEKTHGLTYVGIFSVGFAIAQRFSYASETIAQQVFFPEYYKKINDTDKINRSNAWMKLFYSCLPVYVLTLLFTVIFSSLLIDIFSGPQYQNAQYFVVTGAFFHFFRKITAIFAMSAHSEMKTSILIKPYFVGAIFSSVIVFYFSDKNYNLPATIITIGSFFMLVTMIYNTKKLISFKWSNKEAFQTIIGYFK